MEILIFSVLIVLSAFFSATETAFFSLHASQIKLLEQKNKSGARRIAQLKKDPQRLLITILIGNNIVNLYTASLATVVASAYFESSAIGVATGMSTFFILIFGEIIPKSMAIIHAKRIVLFVARPIYGFYFVLYPISSILMKLNVRLVTLFGGNRHVATQGITEEEIRIMARMSVESGHIDYREREMIENIFHFDDIEVGDILTPMYKVELLNGTVPVDQIAHFVGQSGHSRYPVYDDNDLYEIIGYIHVNTIMRILNSDERDRLVKEFVSPLRIIDEHMKLERVFRLMKKDVSHMFLVHRHDKKDDILGLVTLEDVIEEIVGDIEDETDSLEY